MKNFYANPEIVDTDVSIEGFTHIALPYDDMKRGIFQMSYSLPQQYELGNLFAPIFPLAVRYGLERPGLLYSVIDGCGHPAARIPSKHRSTIQLATRTQCHAA